MLLPRMVMRGEEERPGRQAQLAELEEQVGDTLGLHWTLDTGHWTLDTGHWTLDTGHWTLDTGHWTLDTRCPAAV
jgi:hypothetical protein